MSLSIRRNTELDMPCGCVACGVCEGVGAILDGTDSPPVCEACNGLAKSKMCKQHAMESGWIKENDKKQIQKQKN